MSEKTLDSIFDSFAKNDLKHRTFTTATERYERYEEALKTSTVSHSVVLKRHPKDAYVNNYNPEWIYAWNGNMDIQICLDFHAIITYITEYYTKDDTGTLEHLKAAAKEFSNESDLEKKIQMKNTYVYVIV